MKNSKRILFRLKARQTTRRPKLKDEISSQAVTIRAVTTTSSHRVKRVITRKELHIQKNRYKLKK